MIRYEYAVIDGDGTVRYRSYHYRDCLEWLALFEDNVPGYRIARRCPPYDEWRFDWQDN